MANDPKVYYEIITPLMAARCGLKTDAYNQASLVMNNISLASPTTDRHNIPWNLQKKAITDDTSLTDALEPYTETLFKNQFSYKWGGGPTDYTNDRSYLKMTADELGYFEDGKTDGVDALVKNTLLKWVSALWIMHHGDEPGLRRGVSLPDWTSSMSIDLWVWASALHGMYESCCGLCILLKDSLIFL